MCGVNELSFGNECEARCEGVFIVCLGTCPCEESPQVPSVDMEITALEEEF